MVGHETGVVTQTKNIPTPKVVVIIQEKKSNCLSSHSRKTAVGPSQVLYSRDTIDMV